MNKLQKVLIGIFVALLVFVVAFYLYDIVVNGSDYRQQLPEIAIVTVSLSFSIYRVASGSQNRKSLLFYEKRYANQLNGVYSRDVKSYKKLLKAIRMFNEGKFKNALSVLDDLKSKRPSKKEMIAVCLFSALCYEGWGIRDKAISEYEQLLCNDPENSTVLSNLSILYKSKGEFEKAERCCLSAIESDPKNHYAYNNLAQLYYSMLNLKGAVIYAHKALELCENFKAPASLLAAIYCAVGDDEGYALYRHVAISNGADGGKIERLASDLRITLNSMDEVKSEEIDGELEK